MDCMFFVLCGGLRLRSGHRRRINVDNKKLRVFMTKRGSLVKFHILIILCMNGRVGSLYVVNIYEVSQ